MPPITRSPVIEKLIADEYEVEVAGTTLIIHNVPYVKTDKTIGYGTLFKDLELNGDVVGTPSNHQMWWKGDLPCDSSGTPLTAPAHGRGARTFDNGWVADYAFSAKPHSKNKHDDYHSMVSTYVRLITRHARKIDGTVTAQNGKPVVEDDPDSPFHYRDSATTRANIVPVQAKLAGHKVGIVGLGGTGSYVLDFLVKTPAEIYGFDDDRFSTHNSFRSPGAASLGELREVPDKVKFHDDVYGKLRRNRLHLVKARIDETTMNQLDGLDFVFICVDRQANRRVIWEGLRERGIPFIDTGLGLHVANDKLGGQLKIIRPELDDDEFWQMFLPGEPGPADIYNTNVQVVELNALAACLAVIQWKKHIGFYMDFLPGRRIIYVLDGNVLGNKD